jgi:hypothetical protein
MTFQPDSTAKSLPDMADCFRAYAPNVAAEDDEQPQQDVVHHPDSPPDAPALGERDP